MDFLSCSLILLFLFNYLQITAGTMEITSGTTSTLSEDPFSSLRFCFYMRHAGIYNMLRCFSTKVASTEGTPLCRFESCLRGEISIYIYIQGQYIWIRREALLFCNVLFWKNIGVVFWGPVVLWVSGFLYFNLVLVIVQPNKPNGLFFGHSNFFRIC